MPVDMSVPNSIIAAFLQARKLRLEQEEQRNLMAYRAAQLEQGEEQFQERLKFERDRAAAINALGKNRIAQQELTNKLRFIEAAYAGKAPVREAGGKYYLPQGLFSEDVEVKDYGQMLENAAKLQRQKQDVALEGREAAIPVKAAEAAATAAAVTPELIKRLEKKAELDAETRANLWALGQLGKEEDVGRKLKILGKEIEGRIKVKEAVPGKAPGEVKPGEELSPDLIKGLAEQAATGVINTTDLPKMVGGIKNVPKVYAEMDKMRLAPLNQKQIDNLEALKMVSRVERIFVGMNDIIQAKGRAAFFDTRYSALKDELKQVAPLVRGLVRNAGAFSNQDADRAEGGAPSLNDGPLNTFSKKASQHKADAFSTLVRDRRKSIMGKLSLRHQRMLQEAYELNPDPDLEEAK